MLRQILNRFGWWYLLEVSKEKGLIGIVATAAIANRLSERTKG